MRFERDQTARARNRRVVGWLVTETDPEKIAQRQQIFGAPGNAALRLDAFEVAHQQQPEVDPRRQPWAAHRLSVEPGTCGFHEIVESVLGQQFV
jgi:hypothetical protein